MENLKKQWDNFGGIVLTPWFLIFFGGTVMSLIFAIYFRENLALSSFLTILGSITGGVAGSIFQSEHDKFSGKNILEKKGRSAIRNLESINTQLLNIRNWIPEFITKNKKRESKEILEEIDRHLETLQLNITSGLEDWVDIVPELKVHAQQKVELDKQYIEVIQGTIKELWEKRKELAVSKDKKREVELRDKIIDLEKQIKDIQKERSRITGGRTGGSSIISSRDSFIGFGGSAIIDGSNNSTILKNHVTTMWRKKCIQCGNLFDCNPVVHRSDSYCMNCLDKNKGNII